MKARVGMSLRQLGAPFFFCQRSCALIGQQGRPFLLCEQKQGSSVAALGGLSTCLSTALYLWHLTCAQV